MNLQVRIPASITGSTQKNYVFKVTGIFSLIKYYLKAKKMKADAMYLFF